MCFGGCAIDSVCVEWAFMLLQDWAPMNRLHRLPLALVSRISPSALPKLPHHPCNCCQYRPAWIQMKQEASATNMDSNVCSPFVLLTQTAATLPPICVCLCSCEDLCVIVSALRSVLHSSFVPGLSQTVSLSLRDKSRFHNLRLYKKPCGWVSTCVEAPNDAQENQQRSG